MESIPPNSMYLQTLQNMSENDTDSEDFSEQLPQREEWKHLADIIPGSFVITTEQIPQPDYNSYDWQNDKCKYAHHIIGGMPSWIKSKQDTFSVTLPQQNISISTFSDVQAHAYNIIRKHSDAAFPKDPLFVIVNGVAGTGKSYLINAIRNVLRTSCTVTATTGKAAYNINGCTIHSLLKLLAILMQDSPVKKQAGYIVDPSGYIKIIFWGEHVDSVTPQSTYFFSNLRMKVSQNEGCH